MRLLIQSFEEQVEIQEKIKAKLQELYNQTTELAKLLLLEEQCTEDTSKRKKQLVREYNQKQLELLQEQLHVGLQELYLVEIEQELKEIQEKMIEKVSITAQSHKALSDELAGLGEQFISLSTVVGVEKGLASFLAQKLPRLAISCTQS